MMSNMKLFSVTALMGLSIMVFALFSASTLQATSNTSAEIQRLDRPIAVSLNQRGYNIYALESVSGKLVNALHVDMATVDTLGVPEETTLLANSLNPITGAAINVYRLDSGEFRVDTLDINNQMYSMTWDENGNILTNMQ
jgi:hypothetical protein